MDVLAQARVSGMGARIGSARMLGATGFVAALLAGCAVGPNFAPPKADTPAVWRAAANATVANVAPGSVITTTEVKDAAWWKSFGDPELSSLIERAALSNLSARQAVLRIDEARDQRRLAAAGAWPQVTGVASYQNSRISERTATTSLLGALAGHGQGGPPGGVSGAPPGLSNPFNQYQYGLSATWELDLFGRVKRSVEAADADTEAAVEDARAVRVSLMAEVAAAYIDLRGAQARRAEAEDNLATARALVRLAEDARQAGLGNDLDVASARGEAASAESQVPPLDRQAAGDRNQLTLLLAAQPGALDAELNEVRAIPPAPPQVPIGLPADLARRRPDIRAAEAQLHAAVARQGVAVASLYPDVSLNTSLGLQASLPSELLDWAAHYLTVGPTLDLPIFDAGQRRASVHLQDVRAREAALAYAQTVLGALHEVEDAITAYDDEQARRASLQIAADESRATLVLARRRYAAGSVSFREVLDAEEHLQQADQALTASTAAASQDLVGLYKALGGGWETGEIAAARP
ncbi:MAG: efflux transporter outer membrane subunit [Caulobacterales bacterium]